MATRGRTRPAVELDLESRVASTGAVAPERLNQDHATAWRLCEYPTAVAEIAGRLGQPLVVTKILLADLIEAKAVTIHGSSLIEPTADFALMERVLSGIKNL